MRNECLIGIDMGATNLNAGLIKNGNIDKTKNIKIDHTGTKDTIVNQIIDCISAVKVEETQSIGIGVPSVVDVKKGIVYDVINIPSWDKVNLKEILERKFDLPVFINNDSNCFVLGEKYFGKAQGYDSIVGLTLGSGFGSGLILNGELYWGNNCGAGEVGMLPYRNSIFEHYCSGMFFERKYGISGDEAFKKVKVGNEKAIDMYRAFGTHLGNGIKAVLFAYDPEIIVLGGSIRNAFPYFEEQMHSVLDNFAFGRSVKNLKIEVSELEHSALLGAAALAMDQ